MALFLTWSFSTSQREALYDSFRRITNILFIYYYCYINNYHLLARSLEIFGMCMLSKRIRAMLAFY